MTQIKHTHDVRWPAGACWVWLKYWMILQQWFLRLMRNFCLQWGVWGNITECSGTERLSGLVIVGLSGLVTVGQRGWVDWLLSTVFRPVFQNIEAAYALMTKRTLWQCIIICSNTIHAQCDYIGIENVKTPEGGRGINNILLKREAFHIFTLIT